MTEENPGVFTLISERKQKNSFFWNSFDIFKGNPQVPSSISLQEFSTSLEVSFYHILAFVHLGSWLVSQFELLGLRRRHQNEEIKIR